MRHRRTGRHLGRTPSHRIAMFRNMMCSLLRTCSETNSQDEFKIGRIITTVQKAKELRSYVDKLVTIAKRGVVYARDSVAYASPVKKGEAGWDQWRRSEKWQKWVSAVSPTVALRRRAFRLLRDSEVVKTLFSDVAPKFLTRNGGYTRVVKMAARRKGDGGQLAILEFTFARNRK